MTTLLQICSTILLGCTPLDFCAVAYVDTEQARKDSFNDAEGVEEKQLQFFSSSLPFTAPPPPTPFLAPSSHSARPPPRPSPKVCCRAKKVSDKTHMFQVSF